MACAGEISAHAMQTTSRRERGSTGGEGRRVGEENDRRRRGRRPRRRRRRSRLERSQVRSTEWKNQTENKERRPKEEGWPKNVDDERPEGEHTE